MKPNKVGLALGLFLGLMCALWEVVLALGVGQELVDWKLSSMFSTSSSFVLAPFDLGTAVFMVIAAIVKGYVIGAVFSAIYNKVNK
jgi:hypothetical protein